MTDGELRNLVARAGRVHLGSMDGIHDLITDAFAHLHEPSYDFDPVLPRNELENELLKLVEERERDWPGLAKRMGILRQ